jgi:endoribonuclease Dicer
LAGESENSASSVLEASGVISHDITNVSLDGCQDDVEGKFILDPVTSHRLYPFQAVSALHYIAAELPVFIQTCVKCPFFEYTQLDENFLCIVVLSLPPPLQRISGPPCLSKVVARRSACFITLQKLFEEGLLDSHHFPLPDNEALSTSSISPTTIAYDNNAEFVMNYRPRDLQKNGMRTYPRKFPDFWNNATDPTLFFPNRLFPVIIFPRLGDPQMAPIVLLTRLPLPSLPSFDLFFCGTAAEVSFLPGRPFSLDDSQIQDLRRYTLRLHRMISNKGFVCDSWRMPYFLAPLDSSWKIPVMQDIGNSYNLPDISPHIPWDAVSLSASEAFVDLKAEISALDEELHDAIIQERRMEYTRRYFVTKIRHDLTPLSKPFEGEVC